FPEYPVTRFPKGVPQGPKRIPSYTVEDLDKEWSRKELPSRQCGRYAQYDPESYFEQELLKETNWKKFLKEEKAARKS
ncbi:Protein CBG11806, partial [Caenorhabditis briggsae]